MATSRDPAVRELNEIVKLCGEKGVDTDIITRLKSAIELAEQRDAYCASVSSPPSEALDSIYKETLSYPFQKVFDEGKTIWKLNPRMMSGHFEGKFLQSVVSMSKAKRVLEIGMFTGYAALACAEVLPDDGTVTTLEIDPFLENLAKEFFAKSPHGKKITIKIGPAKDSLAQLVKDKAQFDVVFIDADKQGYIDYFKAVVDENLLAPGGTVVLDNAMMWGHAYLKSSTNESGLAIRKTNEYLKSRTDLVQAVVDDNLLVPGGTVVLDNAMMGGHAYLKDSTNQNGLAIRKVNAYLMSRDDLFRVLVPIRDGALVVRRKSETYK